MFLRGMGSYLSVELQTDSYSSLQCMLFKVVVVNSNAMLIRLYVVFSFIMGRMHSVVVRYYQVHGSSTENVPKLLGQKVACKSSCYSVNDKFNHKLLLTAI